MNGVMQLAKSLDSLGIFARSASDLRLVQSLICISGKPSDSIPDSGPRVALMRGPHWRKCSKEAREACLEAMRLINKSGADTEEFEHPPIFEDLAEAQKTVMEYEIARSRKREYENHHDLLSSQFADLVDAGRKIKSIEYRNALQLGSRAQRQMRTLSAKFDAVLTPATAGEAPVGFQTTGDPLFSRLWTLLQLPAVAIPFGKGKSGMPLSLQLVGRKNEDEHLVKVSEWIAPQLDAN